METILGVLHTAADQREDRGDPPDVILMPGREQAPADKVEHLPLVRFDRCIRRRDAGGNNGVVIRHLRVIDEATAERTLAGTRREQTRVVWRDGGNDLGECLRDILRQIAAVGARVTDELVAFVERLRQFQSALGAKAVEAVGVPLEFREVIQQWRRHAAYLGVDLLDLCRAAADALDDGLGFVAVGGEFHGRVERLDTGMEPSAFVGLSLARRECRNHVPVIFGDEIANREFPLHQHGERWGLDAANGEFLVAGQRVGAREVHAHQPVGPAAAARRIGQMVILAPVAQFRETLSDRLRRQGGNPQTADRPGTSSGFIDVTEDQFSFPARVRCTDNTADARGCEDFADDLELILGLLANHQRPRFRKHRQQVAAP